MDVLEEMSRRVVASRRVCEAILRDDDVVTGRQLREVIEWSRFGMHATNIVAQVQQMYEERIEQLEAVLAEKLQALDRAIAAFEARGGTHQRKDAAAVIEKLRKIAQEPEQGP